MVTKEFIKDLIQDSREIRFLYNDTNHFGVITKLNVNENFVKMYGTITIEITQETKPRTICTDVENISLLKVY